MIMMMELQQAGDVHGEAVHYCDNNATGDDEQAHGYDEGAGDEDGDDDMMMRPPLTVTTILLAMMSQATSRWHTGREAGKER